MSETPPDRPGRAKLSRRTWIIGGSVAAALGIGLYLWRQHKASAAAAAAPPATTADTGTADVVDQAGELSVIQSELEAMLAAEGTEPAGTTTGTTTPPGTSVLPAPGGLSVTPVANGAHAGWGTVTGAAVYELLITGAGGKGTGTSHYDHVAATTHAQVSLTPGKYVARVRAGKSTADVHGHWTADKPFTVTKTGKPVPVTKGPGSTSGGSSGEGEDGGGGG